MRWRGLAPFMRTGRRIELVASRGIKSNKWGWAFIPLSLGVALVLMAIPLPRAAQEFRPDWVALILIYWCWATPERVGVGVGWVSGLLMDAMQYTLLGQNAFAKAVVVFLASQFHRRIRMFPVWQQAIVVFVLLSIDLGIVALVHGMVSDVRFNWTYWMSCAVGMLVWPFLCLLLRDTKRRVRST